MVSALNLRGSSNSNSGNGQLRLTDDDDIQFYQELYETGEITDQYFEQQYLDSEQHRGLTDDTIFDEYGNFIGDDDYVRDNLEKDAIFDENGDLVRDDYYVRENVELQPMQLRGMKEI